MKRFLFILCLMTLARLGIAQVITSPDMTFSIVFPSTSNASPPVPVVFGQALFYGPTSYNFPGFPGEPPPTNSLDVSISLSAPADDAWILERSENGSFIPVTELTNQFSYSPDQNYILQSVLLTTNQIHSLVAGNLYVQIDFNGTSYLGSFLQYGFIHGPTAHLNLPLAFRQAPGDSPSYMTATAISPNNKTAKLILDASGSTDPFYLPMQFSWSGYPYLGNKLLFADTNVITTNVFNLGISTIILQMSDVFATNQFYVYLQVITARQAVNDLIPYLRFSNFPPDKKQALINILSTAASLFNNGQMTRACTELQTFKQMVVASHLDSASTSYLLQSAQDIINAFRKEQRAFSIGHS